MLSHDRIILLELKFTLLGALVLGRVVNEASTRRRHEPDIVTHSGRAGTTGLPGLQERLFLSIAESLVGWCLIGGTAGNYFVILAKVVSRPCVDSGSIRPVSLVPVGCCT